VKELVRTLIGSGVSVTQLSESTGIGKLTIKKWIETVAGDEVDPPVQVLTVSRPEMTDVRQRSIVLSLKTPEFEVAIYSYDQVAS
jgi:hypothetical protein